MSHTYAMTIANRASQATPGTGPTNINLNAADTAAAFVFYPYTLDPITHIFFRTSFRTGTPPTYRGALESVDTATGNPTGTVLGGGSPASLLFTPPADATWNNTGRWFALDNAFAPVDRVTPIAITYRYDSGTINGSNFQPITRYFTNFGVATQTPYSSAMIAGTWAHQTSYPCFGYKTASRTYGLPSFIGFNTTITTSGHRQCLKWTLPAEDLGTGIVVEGLALALTRLGTSGGSYRVGIWDAAGTELASTGTLSSNVAGNMTAIAAAELRFPTPYTVNAGGTYYFGLQNDSAQTAGLGGFRFVDANDRSCLPYGTERNLATWNGSSWTEDDTIVPLIDLITEEIIMPTGGGSGSYNPFRSRAFGGRR